MALSGVCSEGLRRPSAGLRRKFVIALVRPANLDRCKTFFDLGNYSAGRCPEYCCARDGLQVSRPRMEPLGFTKACPLSRQCLRARTILDVFQSPQAFATKGCSLARKRHWNCSFLGVAYLHPWVYNGNRLDRLLHSRAPCHAAESDDRIAM